MTREMIIVLGLLIGVLSFSTKLIMDSMPMNRDTRKEVKQLWLGLNIGFVIFLLIVIGIEIYY